MKTSASFAGGKVSMNMKELIAISEIANYHSFSDAADSLSYSPSTISKYVFNVEQELDIKLFTRSTRSNELSLTAEGRILLQDIQRICNNYSHMLEMVKQLKDTFENILRVGSQGRLGNQVEQEILASFLLNNGGVNIEHVKLNSRDLLRLLSSGKLDAVFVSVPTNASIEEYYKDMGELSDVEIILLSVERDIYLGISDQYLPHINKEASFAEFKDFSFAFSFPGSSDEQDSKAIKSFDSLAKKHGFELNAMYFGAYDATIIKLATKMPIAVATTNIPAQYEGIKFVRVNDWPYYTNIFFMYMKNNHKKTLQNLKKAATDFNSGS